MTTPAQTQLPTERNAACIRKFYEAFARLDAEAMAECYHAEARFTDEAFIDLDRESTVAMWSMLCARARNFSLTFSDIQASDKAGSAKWEPIYLFTSTGRTVHNIISSEFEFKDGKIWRQRDRFSFYRWARQAFGPVGWAIGWTGAMRNKVRAEAAKNLRLYMEKRGKKQNASSEKKL
jgi:ketosteroid isomerase-like protein